ncbi:MAG: endonuclease Q family protein [Candidatus Bathyarchaeota archaeon]|nr:endonuclease Q family protein [Candidatus Bathyarchaeota archaeon]MDW8039820.1 endonuclease Q family protein [Nitrososphaerota archaeon]
MRVIADLHIHGRYSRATSQSMRIGEIARFAKVKGLNLVGTGDFTHPKWLKELQETLAQDENSGLYKVASNPEAPVHFMITTEVSTVFTFKEEAKKIHHVILTPSIETAVQINERLAKYGDLTVDGRPTLDMSAPQLVEEVMEVSKENMVFPAHAWTPWFSIFGAFSGFDSVEDCYQDMTKHIHAIETGLSSDPPMNWRLSKLDKFTLVSNSDSHSYWPWRMGREANVFELKRLSYREVVDAIRTKDKARFKFTIETDPAYGKYHWTGHRNCRVSLSPKEAIKLGNVCPVCRKKLTKGVEQRVEELADRPAGYVPENTIGYMHLLPLSEIIAATLGVDSPSTQQVWNIYDKLVEKFGDEYTVLIDAPSQTLKETVDQRIAEAIIKVREGKIRVIPGYDGVYGQPIIFEENKKAFQEKVQQLNLTDFM